METTINIISNTYGCLVVKQENNKYFMIMEDCFDNDDWTTITKELYDELIKVEKVYQYKCNKEGSK